MLVRYRELWVKDGFEFDIPKDPVVLALLGDPPNKYNTRVVWLEKVK